MRDKEIVVVTGASAGVGRAAACEFAKHGATVALLARGRDGLEGARRDVERLGGEALVIPCDVSDSDAVEAAAAKIERRLGPIDIWVNNAMTSVFSPFIEMTADEFKRVTEVTYLGFVYGTMAALKRMVSRDHGTIVQVGSALAYRSIPLQSAYCGAKHAIVGFTDSIRCELIHQKSKVHMTVVHMPALNTPQFGWVKSRLPKNPQPVPPIFQPEVAASAIYWAAHHRRRELWVGGSTTVAMIGQKIAPGFADWYLGKTGFDSQQTDAPTHRDPRPNLWDPLPGDHGAHGSFDDRASDYSWELTASKHKHWIWAAGLALAGAGVWGATRLRDVHSRADQPGSNRLDDQRDSSLPLNAERFDTPKIQAG
jgi:NAD(P)-dependent dehydrogenase (short-subunit alcohol dehydrogenase family)